MQKVVILTPDEYDNLVDSEKELVRVLDELKRLINSPEELREFIADLLDIE